MARKKVVLAHKIYRDATIKKMQERIDLLGYKDTYDATIFLNIRLLTSTFIFFMVLYLFEWGYIMAPLVTFLYYSFLPKFAIDKKVEKRRKQLDGEAMYFFEVLTLALESGKNLANSISLTASSIDGALSLEFRKAMSEVTYGKSLDEALLSLKKRIPSDTINNIILNMSQANLFGNSVIEAMYNQIDYIRDKRIMETKGEISRIPIQVSVVSVVFFIPLLLLMILAPVIIDYLG